MIKSLRLTLIDVYAYPCRWYLVTSYDAHMRTNLTVEQETFQRLLIAARQNIEQTIGILKQRFHVLQRPARYALHKVPSVILACCVLHNLCRHNNMPM